MSYGTRRDVVRTWYCSKCNPWPDGSSKSSVSISSCSGSPTWSISYWAWRVSYQICPQKLFERVLTTYTYTRNCLYQLCPSTRELPTYVSLRSDLHMMRVQTLWNAGCWGKRQLGGLWAKHNINLSKSDGTSSFVGFASKRLASIIGGSSLRLVTHLMAW